MEAGVQITNDVESNDRADQRKEPPMNAPIAIPNHRRVVSEDISPASSEYTGNIERLAAKHRHLVAV